MQNEEATRPSGLAWFQRWPLLLRIPPNTLVLAVLAWLVFVWGLFIAADILGVIRVAAFGLDSPLWLQLFNDRPLEWSQWFLLAFSVVGAAYLAGRLDGDRPATASRFFFLFAIGLGLMLIEEAGNIRHMLSYWVEVAFGPQIFGLPHRVVSEVPYFAALAFVPVYAVLRYGRYAWESVRTRSYLASGVLLYALAAVASALRYLGGFYDRVGAWVDALFFAHRFPVPDSITQARAHHLLMDSLIEESVELLAVTMVLAAILAFAADVRLAQKRGE